MIWGSYEIYRSSVTHWCKFSVHMFCCSQDRAVLPISLNKTAPSQEKLFSHIEAGKQLYLGNNTTYEHQTCTNVLLKTCRLL